MGSQLMSENANNTEMGERIKLARNAQGFSQRQVGKALDVSHNAVSSWEQGKFEPEAKHWKKLAQILKITIAYLVEGQGEKPPETKPGETRPLRLSTVRLRNMVTEGHFDELIYPRIAALVESGELDDLLK